MKNSGSPKVYILIVAFNHKRHTFRCLESLKNITYPDFTVVVVDNGSSDGTAEDIRNNYPWVKLIVNDRNLGFTGGHIKGCERAMKEGADYILLLNNDVEVAKDFLERLIDVAESDERIGAVGPVMYFLDPPNRVWSAGLKVRLLGLYNKMLFFGQTDQKIPDLLTVPVISGAALCLKRKVIDEVGFLDDLYFCYNEDVDLCYRMRKAGYSLVTVKASRIWHKVSASSGGLFNPCNQYLMARGAAIFMRKFGTSLQKFIFPPLALVQAVYITLRELVTRDVKAALPKYQGFLDGWCLKPIRTEDLDRISCRFGKKTK
jgi:hypothetical protein